MRKKIALLSLGLMPFAIASALVLSPANSPQSERGQCEQDCNAAFKACNVAPNANRATCSTQYKACRDTCKKEKPSPSPEVSPTPDGTPSPTPEISPSPEVSPSPTPDATPEQTPASQRGQCEQGCNDAFKACNAAPNADRAACSAQYKTCRDGCKDVRPHPSPSPTPGL